MTARTVARGPVCENVESRNTGGGCPSRAHRQNNERTALIRREMGRSSSKQGDRHVTAAKRIPPSTIPAPRDEADDDERDDDANEITIERRISATRRTTRMTKVDERLLAIARGELDPDDPFGGLIPIYDDEPTQEVDESWLMLGSGPESSGENEGLFGDIVPTLRLPPGELLTIGLVPRAAFFASQIDGKRTVGELLSICALDDLAGLEVIDELLRLGAIDLG